nr:hypothetical protein [Tanacetum cinerariifolium]
MADVNVNAPADQAPTMTPPTRTDDQIPPHIGWVPIGKSNCYLDVERSQSNPIFKIAMDILKNTNFFRAFTASSIIPSIYIQHKHKFHPRPDSPLHFPNKEPGLGYLKFSSKGTKREVFGMPIPNELIIADIQAKRSKPGLVTKRHKPTSSLRSVDESVDEGIPEKEPRFDDEEADIQRAMKESLKSVHDAPRGPLPSVVIIEPDSGKFQPLLEVQGKGKEKVSDEQVARDLLTLQTPKKVSPVEHYIFQRCTPASTEPLGHAESPLIYAALGLTESDSESDEEVPHVVEVEAQDVGRVV